MAINLVLFSSLKTRIIPYSKVSTRDLKVNLLHIFVSDNLKIMYIKSRERNFLDPNNFNCTVVVLSLQIKRIKKSHYAFF